MQQHTNSLQTPGAQPLRLMVAALFALTIGITPVCADVVFDDGLMHTINNTTYQNDNITVRNGSTLVFEAGAVVEGMVLVQDTSSVLINGGTFGGAGNSSGYVTAANQSHLIINDGLFGGSGSNAGGVVGFDTSNVIINGGTFGGSGNTSGAIVATAASSSITINGGFFGSTGAFSGAVDSLNGATVIIHGGTFPAAAATGVVAGTVLAGLGGTVEIFGGAFPTPNTVAPNIDATNDGTIKVFGCDFSYPFGDIPDLGGILTGTLAAGESVSLRFVRYQGDPGHDGILTLIAGCDADGDGVPDSQDQCPNSDLRATVDVLGCDSGVPNLIGGQPVNADGCSLADLVAAIVTQADPTQKNHGKFVNTAAKALNALVDAGLITWAQHAAIMNCVGAAR